MTDTDLESKIKAVLVEALQLKMKPAEIDTDAPLFGEGLGLDSIDALELANALQEKFGVNFTRSAKTDAAFRSVRSIAKFIAEVGAR